MGRRKLNYGKYKMTTQAKKWRKTRKAAGRRNILENIR